LALYDAIVDPEKEDVLAVQSEEAAEETWWQWLRKFCSFGWVRGEDVRSVRMRSLLKLRYSLHRGDDQKKFKWKRAPKKRRSMPCWGKMKRNLNPALQRYLEDEVVLM